MNTSDFSKFGNTELQEAGEILTLYSDNSVTDRVKNVFGHSGVKIEFNTQSGKVFMVDDELTCVMINEDGILDLFLFTPDDGKEGFFDELLSEYNDMTDDDKEYLKSFDTEHVIEDIEESKSMESD
jgi:hypothetical protein